MSQFHKLTDPKIQSFAFLYVISTYKLDFLGLIFFQTLNTLINMQYIYFFVPSAQPKCFFNIIKYQHLES